MITQFTLPDYPNDNFEIERSEMTAKMKLTRNGVELEQSNEKGKPFLLIQDNGTIEQLFVKGGFPDFAPFLELNGEKIEIVEKLKWFQYAIGGLPLLLIFVGGLIGGGIGGGLSAYNFSVFRGGDTETMKYVKVIGITILGFVAYLALSMLISSAIGQ
jgi:hypothetical protein